MYQVWFLFNSISLGDLENIGESLYNHWSVTKKKTKLIYLVVGVGIVFKVF